MSADPLLQRLSKHRLEALYDGIYAVAMTLLVLDLKLPEGLGSASDAELNVRLAALAPKFTAWIISFLILASLWIGHQRLFHYVRHVDTRLLWINVLSLLFASLLPFSSSLIGEHAGHFVVQAVYDANMAALALMMLWQLAYLAAHPQLCDPPVPPLALRVSRMRCWSLAGLALLSAGVAAWNPHVGTLPFLLMFPLARFGRGGEARAADPAPPSDRSHP